MEQERELNKPFYKLPPTQSLCYAVKHLTGATAQSRHCNTFEGNFMTSATMVEVGHGPLRPEIITKTPFKNFQNISRTDRRTYQLKD